MPDSLRDAIMASLDSQGTDASTEQPEGQDPDVTTSEPPVDSEGGASDDAEPTATTEETPEASDAGTGEELPDSYFGFDLSFIEPEKRAEVIARFKEQDKLINKLQQRNAQLAKGETEDPAEPPQGEADQPAEVSDADILAAIGISQDDPLYEMKAEVALPIVKLFLPAVQQMQEQSQTSEAEKALAHWQSSLGSLETEFGALPEGVSHEVVIEWALENNVLNPEAAYHAITGPMRARVQAEVARQRAEVDKAAEALQERKRQQQGGVRPRSSNAEDRVEVEPGKDTRSALAAALGIAEKRTGNTLEDIFQHLT